MTSIDDVFVSSDALKAEDLAGSDVILTINKAEVVEFTDEDGSRKKKPVLHFAETEKTFVCNRTNSYTIADHHGDIIEGWVGKQITLYPTQTDFGGRRVPCIRIRPPVAGAKVSQGLPGARPVGGMGGIAGVGSPTHGSENQAARYDERNPPPVGEPY